MQVNTSPADPPATPRSPEVLVRARAGRGAVPALRGQRPGPSCRWQGRRGVHLGRWVRAFCRAPGHRRRELEAVAGLGGLVVFTSRARSSGPCEVSAPRKPQLTELQRIRVERAREIAAADAKTLAADYDRISPGDLDAAYAYSFGVAKSVMARCWRSSTS